MSRYLIESGETGWCVKVLTKSEPNANGYTSTIETPHYLTTVHDMIVFLVREEYPGDAEVMDIENTMHTMWTKK